MTIISACHETTSFIRDKLNYENDQGTKTEESLSLNQHEGVKSVWSSGAP